MDSKNKIALNISIEEKRAIAKSVSNVLIPYLNNYSVVITIVEDSEIIDHGTGILCYIEDTYIIITAAHVVKNHNIKNIHIIGTFKPSDILVTPTELRLWGGSDGEDLDVAYMKLPDNCIEIFDNKTFLTLSDFEPFPNNLDTDLSFFFGFPEVLHDTPLEKHERFMSFAYIAGIEDDIDWCKKSNSPVIIKMDYPLFAPDTFTEKNMKLPAPYGMSGGGIWRSNLNTTPVNVPWLVSKSKLIAISTNFYKNDGYITANRIYNIMYLLSEEFESVNDLLY